MKNFIQSKNNLETDNNSIEYEIWVKEKLEKSYNKVKNIGFIGIPEEKIDEIVFFKIKTILNRKK